MWRLETFKGHLFYQNTVSITETLKMIFVLISNNTCKYPISNGFAWATLGWYT